MKNLIAFIIVLVSFISISFGQARIWSTTDDIITEFADKNLLIKDKDKTGNEFIQVYFSDYAQVLYYLNEDDICYQCLIIPDDEDDLHAIIEKYNKKYIIISDTQWKFYSGIEVAYVKLLETDNGIAYFFWYLPENI